MINTEIETMVNDGVAAIQDERLAAAFKGYNSVYIDESGIKPSDEDAVFAMLRAVWPERYADADFVNTMREERMSEAVDAVYRYVQSSDGWNGKPDDAQRFISDVLGIVTAYTEINVGDRIELTEWVERFPSFQVPPGATGVVTDAGALVSIKMDNPIAGCEEWDNEVQFVLPEEAAEILHVKVVA